MGNKHNDQYTNLRTNIGATIPPVFVLRAFIVLALGLVILGSLLQ